MSKLLEKMNEVAMKATVERFLEKIKNSSITTGDIASRLNFHANYITWARSGSLEKLSQPSLIKMRDFVNSGEKIENYLAPDIRTEDYPKTQNKPEFTETFGEGRKIEVINIPQENDEVEKISIRRIDNTHSKVAVQKGITPSELAVDKKETPSEVIVKKVVLEIDCNIIIRLNGKEVVRI